MNDETIRLILEMTGAQSIEDATRKLQEHRAKIGETAASYDVLERQVGEYAAAEGMAADKAVQAAVERTQVQRAIRQALEETATATASLDASAAGLGGNFGKDGAFGRGILQGSYAIQDFTSQLGTRGLAGAFGAVQNNIPGILTSFGAGAGLAGVVSVVAVGVGLLSDNLGKFTGQAKDAADAVKKMADEADRLRNQSTSDEDKAKKAAEGYLKDLPARVVEQGIRAELTMRAQYQGADYEREQLAQFGVVSETREGFVKRVTPQIEEETSRIFSRLTTDPSARATAAGIARQRPGNFPAGFADAMDAISRGAYQSPDEIAKQNIKDMDAERKGEKDIDEDKKKRTDEIRKRAEEKRKDAEKTAREAKETQDRIDQTYIEDEEINRREIDRMQKARMQGAREQSAAERRAADQAEKDADPLNQIRRQQQDDQRKAAAEALRQNPNWGATPDQLGDVARTAAQLGGGDVAAAVDRAFRIVAERLREENMRAAAHIHQQAVRFQNLPTTSEMFGQ